MQIPLGSALYAQVNVVQNQKKTLCETELLNVQMEIPHLYMKIPQMHISDCYQFTFLQIAR